MGLLNKLFLEVTSIFINHEDKKMFELLSTKAISGDTQAQFNLGEYFEIKSNLKKAVYWYTEAASHGHALAQFNLGFCYEKGNGVEKNYQTAVFWYLKSAKQGVDFAKNNLKFCLSKIKSKNILSATDKSFIFSELNEINIRELKKNDEIQQVEIKKSLILTFKKFLQLAKKGDSISQYNVAFCYEKGEGVRRSLKNAYKWYKKSAKNGLVLAKYNLGFCYACGLGVKRNYKEAYKWYLRAAEQGYAPAQFQLGLGFAAGTGVKKNSAQAEYWIKKAAEQEHEEAVFYLDKQNFKNNKADIEYLIKIKENLNRAKLPDMFEIKESFIEPDLVFVKGSLFSMGSNDTWLKEFPQRDVLVKDFYIGKHPVSQKEWFSVMQSDLSFFKGSDLPVENISWYDALIYCNNLSLSMGLEPVYVVNNSVTPTEWDCVKHNSTCVNFNIGINPKADGFRLPTEAEWEFAAKGGIYSENRIYSGSDDLNEVGWFCENSGLELIDQGQLSFEIVIKNKNITHVSGQKKSNKLGIFDMSGNVWEWCWDTYGNYLQNDKNADLFNKVIRGGSLISSSRSCTVTYRAFLEASLYHGNLGFRLARSKVL